MFDRVTNYNIMAVVVFCLCWPAMALDQVPFSVKATNEELSVCNVWSKTKKKLGDKTVVVFYKCF